MYLYQKLCYIHLILPSTAKFEPFAPTTDGKFLSSKGPNFSSLYIFHDITLFVAPVSNSVFILVLFMEVLNTVPSSVGWVSSILNTSSLSGTHGEVAFRFITTR